jgi:hypothetical protein
MKKRSLTTLAIAAFTVLTTATAALADYPPSPSVLGKTVQTVAPEHGLAFTGYDTILWLGALIALLTVGSALLYWSRRGSVDAE